MPKQLRPITKQHGFTLIELLVVLIVISIIATFAVLATGDFGQEKRRKAATEKLVMLISLAQQKAILEPAILGVGLSERSYTFYRYKIIPERNTGHWQAIKKDRLLRQERLPKGVTIQVKQTQQRIFPEENKQAKIPQIILLPSGDITPFTVIVSSKDKKKKYRIVGKDNGEIVFSNEENQ